MSEFDFLHEEQSPDRRWDDKRSSVTYAFQQLEKLEEGYQQLLGQMMLRITDKVKERQKTQRRSNNQDKGLKELGHQKIVGLMKSQNRRRWYDQDKVLHKVYQDLFILEQDGNPFLSRALSNAVHFVMDYVDFCEKNGRTQSPDEVVKLATMVFYKGEGAAEEFLKSMSNTTPISLTTGATSQPAAEKSEGAIRFEAG